MTLQEFKTRVRALLQKSIDDPEYIDKLDADMEKTFKDAQDLEPILGYNEPSPDGYAFGISMLYPDLP